ncbi:hypothetical protein [Sporosarcina ureilytica]|uniref:Uncharacterized protein n=1 Tax=Sporosarcina ureilytica TaxID=298596 RepID=A0A1D8JGQ6_9BACL|nr:hypothetical protein [Sporosarcina ureilytica]AOV07902.1 hypothetical protein BI350_10380 [Sporosarcina ureilytica]
MDFKVVKIVDEYLIVVDYGLKHDASEGDILEVIKIGEEVVDPDTSDSLGTLDIIKARVKVKNAYEHMSLCISNEKIASNSSLGNFGSTLAALSEGLSSTQIKALKVNTKQISGGYDESSDLTISVGDLVKVREAELHNPDDYLE